MRTRPIPAHSGAETVDTAAERASQSPADDGDDPAAGDPARHRAAQLEQDWSRRRRAPALAYDAATPDPAVDADTEDELVRSRRTADRAAALRPPPDRPAPRR